MKKIEIFKVEGDSVTRNRKHCPKCGPGVFLAQHNNRDSCGKCGYTEFKGGKPKTEKKPEPVKPVGKEEIKEKPIEEPSEDETATEPDPKDETKEEKLETTEKDQEETASSEEIKVSKNKKEIKQEN